MPESALRVTSAFVSGDTSAHNLSPQSVRSLSVKVHKCTQFVTSKCTFTVSQGTQVHTICQLKVYIHCLSWYTRADNLSTQSVHSLSVMVHKSRQFVNSKCTFTVMGHKCMEFPFANCPFSTIVLMLQKIHRFLLLLLLFLFWVFFFQSYMLALTDEKITQRHHFGICMGIV